MDKLQHFQEYVLNALEVIEFKLVRSRSDVHNSTKGFHPSMAHQIFGDGENIFGYKELKVHILYAAGPLHIYLGIEYDGKVDDELNVDLKADDVVGIIAEKLPDGCYFVNMDEFLKTVDKSNKFHPFGEKLAEHIYRNQNNERDHENDERHFEIYYCNYENSSFLKFFSRLQTFVLWFVDAASYIDIDDPQWSYFICYEKYKNDMGEWAYATVGYTTVYEYYAYPEHTRPRISQMLVLPPFQRMGIGTKFLDTIYKYYQTRDKIVDITVEDPSDTFQQMRCFVDARLCMSLPVFGKDEIKKGFSTLMVQMAKKHFKINARQCRKVYEILRLLYTNVHDSEDYRLYRLDIKKRLNASYYKQMGDIKKMEKAKIDTQWLRASLPTREERLERLEEEYRDVETVYEQIVEKLKQL